MWLTELKILSKKVFSFDGVGWQSASGDLILFSRGLSSLPGEQCICLDQKSIGFLEYTEIETMSLLKNRPIGS